MNGASACWRPSSSACASPEWSSAIRKPGILLVPEHEDPDTLAQSAIPAPLVAERPRRREELPGKPLPNYLDTLKHRVVEVLAQGITYRGTFLGHDGQELHLKTATRYVVLTMDVVARVRPLDAAPPNGEDEE